MGVLRKVAAGECVPVNLTSFSPRYAYMSLGMKNPNNLGFRPTGSTITEAGLKLFRFKKKGDKALISFAVTIYEADLRLCFRIDGKNLVFS